MKQKIKANHIYEAKLVKQTQYQWKGSCSLGSSVKKKQRARKKFRASDDSEVS
ncbi:hypothetical protein CIPAW_01G075600 [Carya illinoinensis]|uniref:Uncharacterized protein n=1 Tax=Carya illinoinensis TaxID=32201 RepID=A0A8T1RJK3_CARIL|nr:hypothetical protein CIPAW_01G075600 [Carya illinoinensis]